MKNITRYLLVFSCIILAGGGCGKEASAPASGGMATQGAPVVVDPNLGVDLAELTRELKRWMVASRKLPGSFEEFATNSKVVIPPAPTGKKYALSKEMRVVLVDR